MLFGNLYLVYQTTAVLNFYTEYTTLAMEGHSFYLFGIILDITDMFDSNTMEVYNKLSLKNSHGSLE